MGCCRKHCSHCCIFVAQWWLLQDDPSFLPPLPPCIRVSFHRVCSSMHLCIHTSLYPWIHASLHLSICHFWSYTSDHNCTRILLRAPKNFFFSHVKKIPQIQAFSSETLQELARLNVRQLFASPTNDGKRCFCIPKLALGFWGWGPCNVGPPKPSSAWAVKAKQVISESFFCKPFPVIPPSEDGCRQHRQIWITNQSPH